jgi:hypothetical protein
VRKLLVLVAVALALALGSTAIAPPGSASPLPLPKPTPIPPPTSMPALADIAAAGPVSPLIGHSGFRNLPIIINTSAEAEAAASMKAEADMGLKWSFTAVIWAGFEPTGPTWPTLDPTGAWASLDKWVTLARSYGLHLVIQPTMAGNGVAPPPWAGYRTSAGYGEAQTYTDPWGNTTTKSEDIQPQWAAKPTVPRAMDGYSHWFRKLTQRYKPDGDLARERGWTDGYGVRAWEIDNEPDSYGFWLGAWDDYAEVLTRAATAIHAADPKALVLGPALAQSGTDVLMAVLDKRTQHSTLDYKLNGRQYAIGPYVDVIAQHHYDKVDASGVTVFGGGLSLEETATQHRAWWDLYANHPNQPEFWYPKGKEMWHTEGGLDYSGGDDGNPDSRSRAFIQYLVRGFAAGFSRMTVQDMHDDTPAKVNGRRAVKNFLNLLPDAPTLERLSSPSDPYQHFRGGSTGGVHVLWSGSAADTVASVPVRTAHARIVDVYGNEQLVDASGGAVSVTLPGASPLAPPVYVVEAA